MRVRDYSFDDYKNHLVETMEQLYMLGYTEVKDNTYDLSFNTRAKYKYGSCRLKGANHYEIELNKNFADVSPIEEIKKTIMHELIHSIKGCMNHKEGWKRVVNKVNAKYGYDIERTKAVAEYVSIVQSQETAPQYQILYQGCGHVFKYKRNSKNVQLIRNQTGRLKCSCGSCNLVLL